MRGKVFEKVLEGAINRGDVRLIQQVRPVMSEAKIHPPFTAVHVAFDQVTAAQLRDQLHASGWDPKHIQYLDGHRGAPRNLYPLMDSLASALRNPSVMADARLNGAEKADLWIGNRRQVTDGRTYSRGRVIGVTVKLTESLLVPTNVRAAMYEERAGVPESPRFDPGLGMWRIPVPREFMRDFAASWNLLMLLLDTETLTPEAQLRLREAPELKRIHQKLVSNESATIDDVRHFLNFGALDRLQAILPRKPLPEYWADGERARKMDLRGGVSPASSQVRPTADPAESPRKVEREPAPEGLRSGAKIRVGRGFAIQRSGWCMTGYCSGCPRFFSFGECPCSCHA